MGLKTPSHQGAATNLPRKTRLSTRALTLAAAAAHLRQLISAPLPQAEQAKLDRALLPAWKSHGEAEGNGAWAQGAVMSLEKAIQYSLQ